MLSVSVAEYYAEKSVFITGGTGFMGKVLVEKLLRSCPRLKTVYVLMRNKKGQSSEERVKEYVNNRVFERLQTDDLKKIRGIPGDILLEGLGISDQDWQELTRECNLIFHCAATIRFDTFIKESVNMNVVGTLRVLKLAEEMKKLGAFIHMSTSFCHDDVECLEEKLYPSRYSPRDVIECMRWMDDDLIKTFEAKLIHPLPNTYAFTKCLAEDILVEYQGKFPIAVARPSIVTAAIKEPMPGWVDNINGPTGLIYAAARGVVRIVYCKEDTKEEVIPVDLAINGTILLGYSTGLEKPAHIQVCNMTQSGINHHTWSQAGDAWGEALSKYPLSPCLWYPNARPTGSKVSYNIQVFLFHLLPACALDFLLMLLGQKTFMIQIYKKISYGTKLLQYYAEREWKFKNEYYLSLREKISRADDETFFTDFSEIDLNSYMTEYVRGVREYYCKENPSTLPKAKKLYNQLYILHIATRFVFVVLSLYFLYKYLITTLLL